jgi:ABC-type transport system involved in multi-copper enzyme maturation permease subunit
MNFKTVQRLILKDWYLQRWMIIASLVAGAISLAIVMQGSNIAFMLGLIGLITVLIAIGAHLAIATMVGERKEQTLPFVMSLPISYREYTTAKILGNLVIFMVIWLPLVFGSIALLVLSPKSQGLIPFTAIMGTEILVSTCLIIAVALVTESQAWTIGALMVGNVAVNVIGYLVAHIASIAKGMDGASVHWTSAASALLFAEFATIALLIVGTFLIQSRKKDFL